MCNTFNRNYVANACRHAVSTANYESHHLRSGNSCVLRSDDDGSNSKHNTEFLLNDVLKQVETTASLTGGQEITFDAI
jgi:gamma-glutamyl phosphate reductase